MGAVARTYIHIKKSNIPELLKELIDEAIDAAVDFGAGHIACEDGCPTVENFETAVTKLYTAIDLILERKK